MRILRDADNWYFSAIQQIKHFANCATSPLEAANEKILTKAELTAAGAKYTVLGESGRGGKIINGKNN